MSTDVISLDQPDLGERQLAAIEQSGWGQRFRFVQPRNLAFWVYGLFLVMGAIKMAQFLDGSIASSSILILGFVVFGLYTVPFWLFIHHNDRYEREPAKLCTYAFLWGGVAATFGVAMQANTAVLSLWSKAMGQPWAHDWAPGFTAPFVEELSKGAGLVLLIVLAPKLIRSALDGFILGAFIGLGFQVFEDVLYVANSSAAAFGAHPESSAVQVIVMRGLSGIVTHTLYSAIFGAGLVWFIGRRPAEPPRRWLGLGLMLLVLPLHGALDVAPTFGAAFFPINGAVAIAEIVIGIIVYRIASHRERDWMHDLLAPEVVRGTITQPELDAMAGSRKDRKHFVKAAHGHRDHVQAKHVIHAATDLAEEIAKAGGRESDGVARARSELARLRT
jgi:RsiW-degrading membrane proteinase PrsW (M82 family)